MVWAMSDDEADEELLALLGKSLGIDVCEAPGPAETKVLEGAEYVYDNSIDVAIDMRGAKAAASRIWKGMQEKKYGFSSWSEHELHPKEKNECTVEFIFLMDLLNFSFWSDESDPEKAYAVEYRGKRWTGYWSLVAALQRALEQGDSPYLTPFCNKTNDLYFIGIPITNPEYYMNESECTEETLKRVFRSATCEPIPLLDDRISCMREAGRVLDTVCITNPMTCATLISISDPAFPRQLLNLHRRSLRLRRRISQHPRRQLPLLQRRSTLRRPNSALLQARPDPRRGPLGLLRGQRIRLLRRNRQDHNVRRLVTVILFPQGKPIPRSTH